MTFCSDESLLLHSSAQSKGKVRQSTDTSRGKQKQNTSQWGVERGCEHERKHGNGKANGQSTSQDSLAWLEIDSNDNFFNPNAVHQYLEHSGTQRFTKDAESPLDHLLLFFPDHLFEQIRVETNQYYEKIMALTSHNYIDSGFLWIRKR